MPIKTLPFRGLGGFLFEAEEVWNLKGERKKQFKDFS